MIAASGTMDVRVGVLVLFVLGASWAGDARQLANLNLPGKKIHFPMRMKVEHVFGNSIVVENLGSHWHLNFSGEVIASHAANILLN